MAKRRSRQTTTAEAVKPEEEVKATTTEAPVAEVETEGKEDVKSVEQVKVEEETKPTEETKEVKPTELKKENKKVSINKTNVIKVLKTITFAEAIEAGRNNPVLKQIADTLNRYVETIPTSTEDNYIAHNYSIYNLILSIVNTENYSDFEFKFKYLLGLLRLIKAEKNIDELNFLRYDYKWRWGHSSYVNFRKLVSVIYESVVIGIKAPNRTLDINVATIGMNDTVITNLKRFYL